MVYRRQDGDRRGKIFQAGCSETAEEWWEFESGSIEFVMLCLRECRRLHYIDGHGHINWGWGLDWPGLG